MLVEGHGLPISIEVAGANRHDITLIEATLRNIVVNRPEPREEEPQNLCLDKGYDSTGVRELLEELGYIGHIKARNEEAAELRVIPGYRARRWKVERTHSWLNRFRRILIRWEKKVENYFGMLHLVCAFITYRCSGLLG